MPRSTPQRSRPRRRSDPAEDRTRRIFVNRNLHLGHVEWIGFDLDYTLACYNHDAIEASAYEETQRKLVHEKGYPEEVLRLRYDPHSVIRGLVIDRERGNILKLDRYAYVKLARHGHRTLTRPQRKATYSLRKLGFGAENIKALDTLFALPEACLYADLVERKDAGDTPGYPDSYAQIYDDIREMIDKAHRDGTLKKRIRARMDEYFDEDPDLPATLEALRRGGKKLFLLTNSYWSYTDAVLTHLLDGRLPGRERWLSYFDSIVVGARKPAFFTGDAPFLRVETDSGYLSNVDVEELRLGEVYQGGNAELLERMLGASGEKILYFGDHIYGDILRSKKSSGWRTGLVIEELEDEVRVLDSLKDELREMDRVDRRRRALEARRDRRVQARRSRTGRKSKSLAELDERIEALQRTSARLYRKIQMSFNPHWGELFRAGKEVSLFGHQVEDYACIYTSRVSNFLNYPVDKYFRSHRGQVPHDPDLD